MPELNLMELLKGEVDAPEFRAPSFDMRFAETTPEEAIAFLNQVQPKPPESDMMDQYLRQAQPELFDPEDPGIRFLLVFDRNKPTAIISSEYDISPAVLSLFFAFGKREDQWRHRLVHATLEVILPRLIEEAESQIFQYLLDAFGGYSKTANGGKKPDPYLLELTKREIEIYGESEKP